MKFLALTLLPALFYFHCFAQSNINGHPVWIMQGNIYEVNARQYTPEGTFIVFEKSLPRLKQMGMEALWFMPVSNKFLYCSNDCQ